MHKNNVVRFEDVHNSSILNEHKNVSCLGLGYV